MNSPPRRIGGTALLVEPDPWYRERFGRWLEDAGLEVLQCPGPTQGPGCVGLRGGRCILTEEADVVVLDHRTAREPALEGHYLRTGKPIVGVGPRAEVTPMFGRERIMRLPWPPSRTSLTGAARYQVRGGRLM